DGKVTEEDAEGYAMPFVHVLPQAVNARYWRVEIDDSANPAGHIDLARLFLAPGWQPSRNMSLGVKAGWLDDSVIEMSLGGAQHVDQRPKRRVVQFELRHLPDAEVLAGAFDAQGQLGVTGQLFYVFDPADTEQLHRRALLA
ncbi:MAG: hypothetical protein HQL40_14990, partial [Alphaproteobacteria bacterium]|nr:hypothetical protein [Alphaproteobacteria bacterium]